jgi:hypothetical protein
MNKLHYEINTYFQNGKPEAPAGVEYAGLNEIEPLTVEYFTESGRGTLKLNIVRFFPASAHDLKTFIDILNKARDTYGAADQVYTYLRNVIEDLQAFRLADVYTDEDKKANAKITGFIKKYLANINKIADAFGFDPVADQETESAKMSKARVVVCESMNGKTYAREYDGKQFTKAGSVWHVYKYAKGVFRVAMPGTGFYVLEYCGKISDAPAFITPDIIGKLENVRKNNPRAFLDLTEKANKICEESGIENTSLPAYFAPVDDTNTETETTPAPVESVTTETAPAVKITKTETTETTTDGHTAPAKAEEPIPTETETPATSAGTVRTEKTKPCTPCTMTDTRRKWYNICGNVYTSGMEPNHGARLVKSFLSVFNIRTLTSMHRTEKHGYMNATRSHKPIYTRTGTAPGRAQNRTQSRTNCEVMARGSPENMASLQALILAS